MKAWDKWLSVVMFAIAFIPSFLAGYYNAVTMGYMHSDAMSRVANAFYVLYSRDPHLGAIGFIWNPLPSLVNILFLLPYRMYPMLASTGLAGVLMSCSFTGLIGAYLYRSARRFELNRIISFLLSVLFIFNPITLYFGLTGLSDAPFNFFIIYTVMEFLLWHKYDEPAHLIKSGFGLAFAFWTRYEAVPLGAAMATAMVLAIWYIHREREERDSGLAVYRRNRMYRHERLYQIEGTLLLYLIPAVFSGLLWIWLNDLIMGNPLYFLNSEYSNQAQMATFTGSDAAIMLSRSPLDGLLIVLQKTSFFSVLFAFLLLFRLLDRRLYRLDILVMALMVGAIPAFQYLLVLKQSSFVWFRYFSYVLPITMAWVPYEISESRHRKLYAVACMIGLVASGAVMGYALSNPKIAPDENTTITRGVHYEAQQLGRQVAAYLDENYPAATIMTDSYSAYVIILSTKYPKRLIITSDLEFKKSIERPWDEGVDYFLLPKPEPGAPNSALNIVYPNMFQKGAAFADLVKDFDGEWRLYKIFDPSKQAGGTTP